MMYKRIVLKLSGEIFAGNKRFGLDAGILDYIADEIVITHNAGVEMALVVGGGNIFRGTTDAGKLGIERAIADYVGMLSTVINALILQSVLERKGKITRLMSAIEVAKLAEPYIRRRAIRHLEKGRIVLFASGTGSPYFTTDTAAVLRGIEIGANAILKGTKVNGVYSADPEKQRDAVLYKKLSYSEVFRKKLRVMDLTAITLCSENKLPIVVFNIKKKGNLNKVVFKKGVGTLIS